MEKGNAASPSDVPRKSANLRKEKITAFSSINIL